MRAGMTADPVGLDWMGAVTSLPHGVDRDKAIRLLSVAEVAFLSGWVQANKEK
jgi:hypothetical protein